jgi:8-oxo-dGTP diphosphatase
VPTYDYPRPAVTADVLLFSSQKGRLAVLLIRRGKDPFAGAWALPGGFVEEGESLEAGARRELAEETGVTLPHSTPLLPLPPFGNPGRDPRGWTVSAPFLAWTCEPMKVSGQDDATDATFVFLDDLVPGNLAFDHAGMLACGLEYAHLLLVAAPERLLGSSEDAQKVDAIRQLVAKYQLRLMRDSKGEGL